MHITISQFRGRDLSTENVIQTTPKYMKVSDVLQDTSGPQNQEYIENLIQN